ncbi:hypothetical protein PGB90_003440 [Kerria lacca]
MDYGSVIYTSASKTQLNSLNTIHNTALRLACGTFPTTPSTSLYALCNELPPSLYRYLIFLKTAARFHQRDRTYFRFHPISASHRPYVKQRLNSRFHTLFRMYNISSCDLNNLTGQSRFIDTIRNGIGNGVTYHDNLNSVLSSMNHALQSPS